VLGVSRIHYTVATGAITSKEGAGRYALATFPERWHRVIGEALRVRRGDRRRSLYWSPFSRQRDVLAFCNMVLTDTHCVFREHWSNDDDPVSGPHISR
jgi:hypothetical protein